MLHRTLLFLLLAGTVSAQPAKPAAWPLDELTAVNGSKYHGIVLDETATGVRFRVVRRPPGRPTVTLTTFFLKKEVAQIKKIADADRESVKAKLADLDPTGAGERKRMEALDLTATEWLGRKDAAKRYDSDEFTLASSASEEITRRAGVRLEQIFTAYARFLPPRRPTTARPLTILLAPDKEEYAKLLGPVTGPVLNPAVYDQTANRIICGTDLRRLGQDLSAARLHNVQQLTALDKYEAEVRQLYKDSRTERDRHLGPVNDQRRKVWAVEKANDAKFDELTGRLFALLYHEAFHAYAANVAYPPRSAADVRAGKGVGELPRWLNEGLAQVFETAVLDGGELRVGHADRDRLMRAKDLRKKDGLLPVADLVRTGGEAFVTIHANQKAAADRTYITSWALAFYLAFDRSLLGTAEFDAYLTALNTGGDPGKALEALLGKPLAAIDADVGSYIDRLRPDGRADPPR
jgi:predicted DNA-binding ribbon-helix-helix protein